MNRVRALAAGTAALCLCYVAASMVIRPSLLPDAAYGLLVHQSMRHGAPWNHVIEPSADDIAVDRTYFYAIWSPGQYAVPGLLMDAGLSAGRSIALVSLVASLGGLAGWLLLYRTLGFDMLSALAATTIITASRSFNYGFVAYVGSDVLAFAVFPLLATALLRLKDSPYLAPGAAVATLAAFIAKNSLPIYLGAWLAAQTLWTLRERGLTSATLVRAAAPIVAWAAVMGAIHWGYNSRGWNPLAYDPVASTAAHAYVLPWAMPILAATSWDDVFSWLFSHPAGPVLAFDYKQSLPLLVAIATASIAGGVLAARRHPRSSLALILAFSVIVVTAFTLLLSTGSGASLDLSRHYRIIGYLWLPPLVQAVHSSRAVTAVLLAVVLVAPCVYGVASFAANWRRHYAQRASHSLSRQITHLHATGRVVRALELLDRELPRGSTLLVASAAVYALEFDRTRVLATSAVSDSVDHIRAATRRGAVDNLVLVAELAGMSDEKCRAWTESFSSYHAWESIDLDQHRFYVPVGQPVSSSWLRSRFATLTN